MLKIAIVGCGGISHMHAERFLKLADCQVTALCDIIPERTQAYQSKYFADAKCYGDFDTLLAEAEGKVDAVLLATPHTLHYGQAKAALQRGLHVLTEKPMVTSSAHAYDLWQTVKQTGRTFAIAFQAPATAEYQYLKHLRDEVGWGQVQIIQGWLAQKWKNLSSNTWRMDPALSGGGQMYDSGAHVLNGMMWLMNNPVVEVCSMIDYSGCPVDINGVVVMKFQNGALGSVAIGGNSPGWNVDVRIQTEKMQIRTGPHGGYVEITGTPEYKYPAVPSSTDPVAFTVQRNFVNACLGREPVISTVRHGVLLSCLMDAIYESAEKKAPVAVKPVPDDI